MSATTASVQMGRVEAMLIVIRDALVQPDPDMDGITARLAELQSLYDNMPSLSGLDGPEAQQVRATLERIGQLHATVSAAAVAHRDRFAIALTQLDRAATGARNYTSTVTGAPRFIDQQR